MSYVNDQAILAPENLLEINAGLARACQPIRA